MVRVIEGSLFVLYYTPLYFTILCSRKLYYMNYARLYDAILYYLMLYSTRLYTVIGYTIRYYCYLQLWPEVLRCRSPRSPKHRCRSPKALAGRPVDGARARKWVPELPPSVLPGCSGDLVSSPSNWPYGASYSLLVGLTWDTKWTYYVS